MKNIKPKPIQNNLSPYSRESRIKLEKENLARQKLIGPKSPNKEKKSKKKIVFIAAFLIIISVAAFFLYNAFILKTKVIVENQGNVSPILRTKTPEEITTDLVTKDGDTRINILVTGIGGKGHDGGTLTDSIQIISIDPFTDQASLVSLPRDFYLTLNKTSYKLNTLYQVGEKDNKGGGALMKETIGDILDLDIHYFINIDFEGFVKIIDALGGVTVMIKEPINDPYYPDKKLEGYEPFNLKAGVQNLTGAVALKYARSRKTTSDFDRSKRQQEIILAVKEKALSLGTLANPAKINEIVKIVGNHLKTDVQLSEMQSLAKRYQKINSDETKSLVIDNSPTGPLQNSNMYGSYVLIPKLGLNKYEDLQNLAHEIMPDPKVIKEAAKVEVKYLKSRKAEATKILDRLESYGYIVSDGGILTLTDDQVDDLLIIRNEKAEFTRVYLTNRYDSLKEKQQKQQENFADIEIILGKSIK